MTSITNNFKTSSSSKPEMEDFFQDFWLEIKEKSKKEKLEQEILTLRRRELRRKYASFTAMVPLAAFIAIELSKVYSDWMLLSVISGALSHLMIPLTVLSLICTLYLIYNNDKIKKKEQELRDLENGEIIEKEKKDAPYNIDDYFNYIDVVLTMVVIISEILSHGVVEDTILLTSSLFGFIASATFCYKEYKQSAEYEKGKEEENPNLDEKSEKKTNNMYVAKLMFAGSSVLLIKRIMLMAFALSLNPAIGPALGLVGIMCLMVGQALTIYSYNSKLKDVKVSGKGVVTGAPSNTIASAKAMQNDCNTEGMAIA